MTKGTASMGKKNKTRLHLRCRRCGHSSYHRSHSVCSHCGFGKSARMRKYDWQKK